MPLTHKDGPAYYNIVAMEPLERVWEGRLTQDGTSHPEVIVYKNTLGGELNWVRDTIGMLYAGMPAGITLGENAYLECIQNLEFNASHRTTKIYRYDASNIALFIGNGTNLADNLFAEGSGNWLNIRITNR